MVREDNEVIETAFYQHRAVRVMGNSPDEQQTCIEYVESEDGTGHHHVPASEVTHERYPDVEVELSTGRDSDGNTMMIIGAVRRALRHAGYGPQVLDEFSTDVMNAESPDDALRRVMRWVAVS